MFRIVLVNMPFASLERPSLALTQIRTRIEQRFAGEATAEIHYLNQEFVRFLGFSNYELLAESGDASAAGAGEWFFRQVAFPELDDNSYEYFRRYFPNRTEEHQTLQFALLEKRRGIERCFNRMIDRHRFDRADIVAFTSMFAQNAATFGMARLLKERNPDLTVVMGGANCETPMGEEIVRNIPSVDFVFSGPSLVSFPELVAARMAGDEDACHRIAGVFSRENLSGRYPTPRVIGQDLPIETEVPLDYDGFFSDLKTNLPEMEKEPCVLFETSRGCWWGERSHCTFCGLNGSTMKYRAMPADKAIGQFESLFARYAGSCTYFESVDNILPRSYLTDVLPHVSPPPDVTIFYEVKADLKADEMRVMADAGVRRIQPGIESLSTPTLKLMKKGTTSFINLRFLRNCSIYGITPLWNILVGFPGEADDAIFEKYLADLPRLVHLPPPITVATVAFQRFSPYFVRAEEHGLDLRPAEYYHFIYPFPEEVLSRLGYYFVDDNRSAPYAQVTARWVEPLREAVAGWRRRYEGDGGAHRAELHFDEAGDIYDTRDGTPVVHRLDPRQREILEALEIPRNTGRLANRLDDDADADVEAAIESLEALGLVFREGDQVMSLVLPRRARAAARAA